MICPTCKDYMQQDLDSQGRLEWFCLNPDCPTNKKWMENSMRKVKYDQEEEEYKAIVKEAQAWAQRTLKIKKYAPRNKEDKILTCKEFMLEHNATLRQAKELADLVCIL